MTAPREWTPEEVQRMFLDHVYNLVAYWKEQAAAGLADDPVDGVAFSILSTLDGESSLPKFLVVADPHPEDREFRQREGSNWYRPVHLPYEGDIAGTLHERMPRQPKSAPVRKAKTRTLHRFELGRAKVGVHDLHLRLSRYRALELIKQLSTALMTPEDGSGDVETLITGGVIAEIKDE